MPKHIKFFYFISFFSIQSLYISYLISKKTISVFGTNDDALMALLLKNAISGNIDTKIIFIKPILSWVLGIFQAYLIDIYIYSFALIFFVILSTSLVFTIFMDESKKIIIKLLIILIFYTQTVVFLKWFFINPTYTGASLISVFSFLSILTFINIRNLESDLFKTSSLTICLSSAYLVREESLFILLWFSTAILLINYKKIQVNIKLFIKCVFILIFIIISNLVLENKLYATNEWKSYIELNSTRHKIQQRSTERNLEQRYLLVNWTRDEYILFTKFLLTEKNKYNVETLKQIILNEKNNQEILSFTYQKKYINVIVESFRPWTWLIQTIVLILIFTILFGKFHKFGVKIKYLLTLLVTSFFLILILASLYQIPERISFNLLYGLFLILIAASLPSFHYKNILYNLILISLLFFGLDNILGRAEIENSARQNYYLTMQKYFQNQVEFLGKYNNVIIANSSTLKIDWQDSYFYKKQSNPDYDNIILMSWLNLSPTWSEHVNYKKLNSNNFWTSTVGTDTLLFSDPYTQLIIEKYLTSLKIDPIDFTIKDDFEFDELKLYKSVYRKNL